MRLKYFFLFLFGIGLQLFLSCNASFAEGTKEVRPDSTTAFAALDIRTSGYTQFARTGTGGVRPPVGYRLYIHIHNVNEVILFGLKTTTGNVTYRLRNPTGTVVKSGTCPTMTNGQPGLIKYFKQATIGPFNNIGGYDPIVYKVTDPTALGDYSIDFDNSQVQFDPFDFQVVNGNNDPALPGDKINGRVFSQSWQFYAALTPVQFFSARFFVYSDDGIVSKLKFKEDKIGACAIFCNPNGADSTGNFTNDRKSKNTFNFSSFPGIARYRVFLNDPDPIAYPNGEYGSLIGTPYITFDPNFPECSGKKYIYINVNKKGNVEIKIILPGSPATDVTFYKVVNAGLNFIAWDGKDNLGTLVPDGTPITIEITYVNGLTNLPLWDIEANPKGFVVTLVRPVNPDLLSPKVFWDDTQISPGGEPCPPATSNLTGCTPTIVGIDTTGCHIWGTGSGECHDKMINTWWYSASTSTSTITNTHVATPPLPVAPSPIDRCGIGSVDVSATVLPGEVVRWWDVASGGTTPIATTNSGVPYTVMLNTIGTSHIYAEAYNPTSLCVSDPPRRDVVLNANPIPTAPTGSTTVLHCGPGQVTITANTIPGVRIDWYDAATGGTLLSSSNPFITPFLAVTTTYYAQSVNITTNCTNLTRTAFTATINPYPTATISGTISICQNFPSPLITFTGASATEPYTFTYKINGGGSLQVTTVTGSSVTVAAPTNVVGTFNYSLVSVQEGSAAACSQTQTGTATVTVNALTTPTLAGENSVCLGIAGKVYTTQGGKNNYVWTIPPEATKTAGGTATDNTVTLTWNTAGTFDIKVNYTEPGTGCTAIDPTSYSVTVNPLPSPSLTGENSVCLGIAGKVYTSEAGKTNYVWNIPPQATKTAGGNATDNTVTVTWNTVGSFAIGVNYSIPGTLCTAVSEFSYPVTVNPLPTPTLAGENSVCLGIAGKVYTSEAGKTNYVWNIPPQATKTAGGTATDNTVTVTWNMVGSFAIGVNYSNPGTLCTAVSEFSYPVTVNPLPTPTLAGENSVCLGIAGKVYTTQAGRNNYVWTIPPEATKTAGGTATDNTVTVTWNTVGSFAIGVNYSNPGTLCTAVSEFSYPVTVNPLPIPTLAGENSVCLGISGKVYTTEAGKTNYVWNIPPQATKTAGGTATDNTVTVTWNTVGSFAIGVNYSNSGTLCTSVSEFSYPVTVNPLPTPSLAGENSVCLGIAGKIYTTEAGKTNYVWNIPPQATTTAGGTATDNTVTVTWNTVGSFAIGVNYSIPGTLCTAVSEFSYPVTVNPLPTPTLAGENSVCLGIAGKVYTTEAGKNNYVWTIPPEATKTAGGTATDNTVTVTWNTVGSFAIGVNYSNPGTFCTSVSEFSYPVTVNPLPTPSLAGENFVCLGIAGKVYTTEAGKTNYVWNIPPQATKTAGGTATDNTVTVTWNTVGSFAIGVNYSNPGTLCTSVSEFSYPVTVNPLPTPSLAGENSVCPGIAGKIYTTEAGKTNYVWNLPPQATKTAGGTATDNTVTVTWNTVGSFAIGVNYSIPGTLCTAVSEFSYPVTVNPLPTPSLAGENSVCLGIAGKVYTTEAGKTNYIWNIPPQATKTAGGTITDNTVTVTWNTVGSFAIGVNYSNPGTLCTAVSEFSYPVTVNPLPTPTITGPGSTCLGLTNQYSTENNMTGYTWNVASGGTITGGQGTLQASVNWTSTGVHTIFINYLNEFGCTAVSPTPQTVSVNTLPTPSISSPELHAVCDGVTADYFTETGAESYSWNIPPAGGTVISGGGIHDATVKVKWANPNTYNVSVNYIISTGCTAVQPTQYAVTVNALPDPHITGPTPICGLSQQNYTVDPIVIGHAYNWVVNGGAIQWGQTGSTVSVLWGNAPTANLNLTETIHYTGTDCSTSAPEYTVTLNPWPVAAGTISGPAGVCKTWNGISYTIPSILYATSYVWNYTGSGATIVNNGNAITISFANNATSGDLSAKGLNSCGLGPVSVLKSIQVNPLPIVSLPTCFDQITTTNAKPFRLKGGTPLGAGGKYYIDGTLVAGNVLDPSGLGEGNHTVSYTYTDANTCVATDSKTITVGPSNASYQCVNNVFTDPRNSNNSTNKYPTFQVTANSRTTCWMIRNLNWGSSVSSVLQQTDNCVVERYCPPNDNSCSSYGSLFQWDELMQYGSTPGWSKGVCPPGWHVPTSLEWQDLIDAYQGNGIAAGALKDLIPVSGFRALLNGMYYLNTTFAFTSTESMKASMFWTSTTAGGKPVARGINVPNPSVSMYESSRSNAFPVRCVKD